jgi:hypothetical protein
MTAHERTEAYLEKLQDVASIVAKVRGREVKAKTAS